MCIRDRISNGTYSTMAMKWYVVHTYSGHENKAKLSLQDRVRTHNLQAKFGDVLIPTDTVVELVKGQKRSTTRKFFPGYIFVEMDLDQETFHLVKNTPKITGFLGGTNPQKPRDLRGVLHQMKGLLVQVHLDEDVPGEELSRGGTLLALHELDDRIGRDEDVAKLRLQVVRAHAILQRKLGLV